MEAYVSVWVAGLPALSVRDRRVLLLTCDEGGPPHGAAVAIPQPAYRRGARIWCRTEPVLRLGLCCERRG